VVMAAKHGSRRCYVLGCRCADCTAANSVYSAQLRRRHADGEFVAPHAVPVEPGPGQVELAVAAELEGLTARPALGEIALSLARVLDGRNLGVKPSAARQLVAVFDELHKAGDGRRGRLALVKAMTSENGGA
jgi:hypothetical protein